MQQLLDVSNRCSTKWVWRGDSRPYGGGVKPVCSVCRMSRVKMAPVPRQQSRVEFHALPSGRQCFVCCRVSNQSQPQHLQGGRMLTRRSTCQGLCQRRLRLPAKMPCSCNLASTAGERQSSGMRDRCRRACSQQGLPNTDCPEIITCQQGQHRDDFCGPVARRQHWHTQYRPRVPGGNNLFTCPD